MASAVVAWYESFVKANASWLLPLEETARSLTIFLPGRFSESELQSEAIYAFLNLSSLSHDRILGRPDRSLVCDVKPSVPETKTTRRLQNVLTFFHYTEVLIEMAASRVFRRSVAAGPVVPTTFVADSQIGGQVTAAGAASLTSALASSAAAAAGAGAGAGRQRGKWLVILLVELIKVYCRLRLLQHNKGRILCTPSADDAISAQEKAARKAAVDNQLTNTQPELAKYSDLAHLYLDHGRGAHPHGMFSRYTVPPVHPREAADFKASRMETIGEALYFVRPIVYVAARLVVRNGHESWTPFVLSLLTDIASRVCTARAAAAGQRGATRAVGPDGRVVHSKLTAAERTELGRRLSLFAFYLLRSPLFDRFTKIPLLRVGHFLNSIPIIGVLFGNLLDLMVALQSHYFYTSAS